MTSGRGYDDKNSMSFFAYDLDFPKSETYAYNSTWHIEYNYREHQVKQVSSGRMEARSWRGLPRCDLMSSALFSFPVEKIIRDAVKMHFVPSSRDTVDVAGRRAIRE
jgi:hypothetical protein